MSAQTGAAVWFRATRAFSFTASMTPVLLGTVLAYAHGSVDWVLFIPVALAALFLHAGTNMINDYYDFKNGIDTAGSLGSSGVLVEGLLQPQQVRTGALLFFAAGIALGIYLGTVRGWFILLLGIIGFLGGYFYTARPVAYKYRALGDFCVFALMGPLMVIGAYYMQTGRYDATALLVSLPIGFLVTLILHANNIRDVDHDRSMQMEARTLAMTLGERGAKAEYAGLVLASYGVVAALVGSGVLPIWSLLVLVTLPLGLRLVGAALRSGHADAGRLTNLDQQSAQLHMLFGVLLIVSLVVGKLVG